MKGKIINLQLDDSFYKEEIRDGYTVTTKQKKIWAVEMDLLDQLLKVCKKHDIKVIIYAGTLLGAIRHKGFIPWDDDIDVALTRPEYEKLLKVAPEEFKAPYFFQTALSDKECFVGYARLRNSLTTGLIAGTETPQYNCGIYIDVFVLDAYIEDSSKLHSQLKERHYWEIFINKFHYFKPSKSLLKRIIGNILHYTICKIVPYRFVIRLYNKTLTRYNGKTDRISLITHTECFALKYWCRLSDFHNIIEVPFENMIIPIPANYDEILKHMYGDYMTFPPAEKRGAWHEGILEFEPDIPYADFFKKKNMKAKEVIKRIFVQLNVLSTINRLRYYKKQRVYYNVNNAKYKKRCLFIYIVDPFIEKAFPERHQNLWQAKEMARIIGTRGYVVDVVDYMNRNAKLKFNYDMVVGLIPRGIDIYTKHMNPGCLRIAYLTSMNLAITTGNEKIRLDELKQRRGIELSPRRGSSTVIGKEIEQFDGAWYIGNKYNFHSYDCFKMPPSFRIVNSGYAFDWAKENIERDSKSFVFFASSGQVHKGLDLLLELFSQHLKDYTLYVCSGYEQEEDFYQEYHKELYETSNIIPMGFVDIESETFREISYKCTFAILPSCAEGCAGSILTAMSAGMIPIVSKECGFEDDEVINLPDCKMETIFGYVVEYSQKDQNWLKNAAKHSMEIVHSRYSKLCFSHSVEKALDGVLANTK